MLHDSFQRILSEYLQESKKDLIGNSLASFIRIDVPSFITGLLENPERYKVAGSPGQGNWAGCPWVAVFDKLVTETAQSGYYPVYLFREDMSGLFFSLNQGVTEVRQKYRSKAKPALRSRAKDYLSQIGGVQEHFPLTEIDLRTTSSSNLPAFYEEGNICACFYDATNIPPEEELEKDLREMLKIYEVLSYNETVPVSTSEREEDESANLLIEDLRKLRQHKRIDRNSKLSREAKRIHGTTCKACGFNFEA
jgi:5-methylcytosine-specific restriction protein A